MAVFFTLFFSGAAQALSAADQTYATAQKPLPVIQVQKNTLVVGSEQDYPPFATGMTDDTAGGFTVELWKAVAAEAGLNYTLRVRPFHQILQEFKEGKVDVLINLAQSDVRHQFADFTVPHVVVHGAIFVRKGQTGIHSEDDFAGKSIIVLNGDLAHDYAVAKGWGKQLVLVDTAAEGMRLLASGKHDAMLLSKLAGMQTLQALRLGNIEALKAMAGFSQKFAFAVHEGQAELLGRINEAMALTKSNGIYSTLYDKWFGIYEVKEVTLLDFLNYIIPVVVFFLGIAGFFFYRRHVEREAAEKKYRDLYDHAPDMYLSVQGKTAIILDCNQTLLDATGFAREELVGRQVFELYHPDCVPRVRACFQKFMETKVVQGMELQLRRKDGSKIDVSLSATAVCDKHGDILHSRSALHDITERKRIDRALQRESEKNIAILHNASDGIHILGIDGNIIDVSDSFCAMLGYRRDEMIGMNVSQWDAKLPRTELANIIKVHYAKQSRSQFETSHRRKDGSIFDVEVSGFPLELEGMPVMFYSSRDITERQKTEANLRIAATAFESHEGMLITDAHSAILQANRAFTETTGYALEEILGKNPRMFASGRQDANFYAAMWESINNTGSWEGEIWNRRKNGEIYPEHLTITAVKNNNGIVTNYVATLSDITKDRAAADEIKQLAFFDPLTQLPNRRLLQDRLQQAMASSARSGRSGALLFIDLDNFKVINDTLGHDIGDVLLQQVAVRLESAVREGDSVARLGGDEFVVMLEDLSTEPIEAAAQTESVGVKIFASLSQPYQLAKHEYRNTPSIGATLFNGHDQLADELFKQADIAMYQAKKAGRNTMRFFDPHMQDTVNTRAAVEVELRKALDSRQFHLYYQIQVDDSGRPLGAEALIRWIHPERGLVAPDQFIPLAEDTGLILPIGQWVIETACAQLRIWQQNSITRDLMLAVNVSAVQFRDADFAAHVQVALLRNGINPGLLKLELTESLLQDNIEATITTMNALKDVGVQFSLDDFGTGYSSLQYLKRLPLNQLKIDQSFVRNIETDGSDKAIVRTIIAMARSLNLDVIAEGVETHEQRQLLLGKGCAHFQGYLFGKPVPIEQFETLLKQV